MRVNGAHAYLKTNTISMLFFRLYFSFVEFLRYSERAIDTRVRFLVLHDYRLFGQRMQHIWKRFINVIFVREYEQHFRKNNRTGTSRISFELSTVPFPYPIKRNIFVTKNLDFWQNGKYRHGTKLNTDKTRNLAGLELEFV